MEIIKKFSLVDVMLHNKLGSLDLKKSDKNSIELILGKPDYVEYFEITNSYSLTYKNPQIEVFYNKDSETIEQFKISTDIIIGKKNILNEGLSRLFSDFDLFYKPAKDILSLFISNNISLYYIDQISDEYSGFYYVTKQGDLLRFIESYGRYNIGAQLMSFSCVNTELALQQAYQNNAIEITKDNFIVPPVYNELKKYPKGKKINW